jgi:hypothetical protein
MNFEQYKTEAHKLATYGDNTAYPILGLISEIGEFHYSMNEAELGDILWYIAECCTVFGIPLIEVPKKSTSITLMYMSTLLAGVFKKIIRGDPNAETIDAYIQGIYSCILFIIEKHELSLSDILEANLNKLYDRSNRNVLKGSGDNR